MTAPRCRPRDYIDSVFRIKLKDSVAGEVGEVRPQPVEYTLTRARGAHAQLPRRQEVRRRRPHRRRQGRPGQLALGLRHANRPKTRQTVLAHAARPGEKQEVRSPQRVRGSGRHARRRRVPRQQQHDADESVAA